MVGEQTHSTAEILPLLAEEAVIEKRQVPLGRVRIRSTVETIEDSVKADLESVAVEVTRVPVDRPVHEAPAIRTEGEITIVPVLEEVLFVEKRLVLKEELHIRRRVTTDSVEVPVTLRRERASIERVPVGHETTSEENER